MTDPRFLDATHDDMLLDAWAAYFKRARDEGQGEVIEDDDFDLEAILADLERRAEESPADDWEAVDQWDVAEVQPGSNAQR